MSERREIIIVGGGPGGYLAALRCAQLGKRVTLIERDRIGGTCMNYGCIPVKYLLHQTRLYRDVRAAENLTGPVSDLRLDWSRVQTGKKKAVGNLVSGISFLLEKGKIEIKKGNARIAEDLTVTVESGQGEELLKAEKIIIASGSRASGLPFIQPDGSDVVTSTEALEFSAIPKSLIICGAGVVGLELGTVYHRAGTDVTILEIMPTILHSSDKEAAVRLERILKRQGLKIYTRVKMEKVEKEKEGYVLSGHSLDTNSPLSFSAEKVLISVGRNAETESLFKGQPFLETDRGGFLKVNQELETSLANVYAIGDVIGGKLLAHKAYYDALTVAETVCGKERRSVDYSAIPTAVFTEPEFASVGQTQEEAEEGRGLRTKIGIFPLHANGRAMTMESTDGMIKIVADGDDKIIGAHIISPSASEMIPVLTMAVARGMKLRDISSLVYIHPTVSEAIGEGALKAANEALHILNK